MVKEGAIRKKILDMDLLEAVIVLVRSLLYWFAACILISSKEERKGKKKVLIPMLQRNIRQVVHRMNFSRPMWTRFTSGIRISWMFPE